MAICIPRIAVTKIATENSHSRNSDEIATRNEIATFFLDASHHLRTANKNNHGNNHPTYLFSHGHFARDINKNTAIFRKHGYCFFCRTVGWELNSASEWPGARFGRHGLGSPSCGGWGADRICFPGRLGSFPADWGLSGRGGLIVWLGKGYGQVQNTREWRRLATNSRPQR